MARRLPFYIDMPATIRLWAGGFLYGVLVGFIVLELPTIGVLAALFGILWLRTLARSRRAPLASPASGYLVGIGACVVALLAYANARCAAQNYSAPGVTSVCVAPDVTPSVAGALALVVAGIALGLVGRRRAA